MDLSVCVCAKSCFYGFFQILLLQLLKGGAKDPASLALTKALALVCDINLGCRVDVLLIDLVMLHKQFSPVVLGPFQGLFPAFRSFCTRLVLQQRASTWQKNNELCSCELFSKRMNCYMTTKCIKQTSWKAGWEEACWASSEAKHVTVNLGEDEERSCWWVSLCVRMCLHF